MDEVERSNKVSERSWADVIGSVASIVDALACLTFLILPADVDIPFPENLRDPVDTHPAAVSFQDLFLILSQSKASILGCFDNGGLPSCAQLEEDTRQRI